MTIEDTPDPAKIMRLAKQALTSSEYRKKFHAADFFGPQEFYEPQMKFFAEGRDCITRGCCAAATRLERAFLPRFRSIPAHDRPIPEMVAREEIYSKLTRGWIVGVTAQACS